jgi:GDP-D-mannose dehydratase
MVKTVLVTGVNGFIGSHVAALLGKSHRVYGTGGAPACARCCRTIPLWPVWMRIRPVS